MNNFKTWFSNNLREIIIIPLVSVIAIIFWHWFVTNVEKTIVLSLFAFLVLSLLKNAIGNIDTWEEAKKRKFNIFVYRLLKILNSLLNVLSFPAYVVVGVVFACAVVFILAIFFPFFVNTAWIVFFVIIFVIALMTRSI